MKGTDAKFARWYDQNAAPHGDDFTFGEQVWRAARKELLKEQRARQKRKSKSRSR